MIKQKSTLETKCQMSETKIFKFKIMKYFSANLLFLALFPLISCVVDPIVLVHGGAHYDFTTHVENRTEGVKRAAMLGYKLLKKNHSVVDAVEAAVKLMEEDIHFNCGTGSALNRNYDVEMDSCIMIGSNLSSGAVTGMKNVPHPVSIARLVMEKSPHFLLAGEGAKRFARDQGVTLIPTNSLKTPTSKKMLDDFLKAKPKDTLEGYGGVGAIAMDSNGHLAAATSCGGQLGKMPGRVSDVAIVGAGIYVDDNVGAVIVTGHGESIARYVMANEIVSQMKRGFDPGLATRNVVKSITEKFRKPTGAITVAKNGQIGISFTTEQMAWAYQLRQNVHYGVDDYDHYSERIKL